MITLTNGLLERRPCVPSTV